MIGVKGWCRQFHDKQDGGQLLQVQPGILPIQDLLQMADVRQKKADFDLFKGPPGDAPIDLFARPPDLFARPPAPAPRAQTPPPTRPPPAPQPQTPPPPSSAPSGPPLPGWRTPTPRLPAAPAPEQPEPRTAPPGRGQEVPQGEETAALRRQRDFKQFLREKYEGGKAEIRHPDPELRHRRPIIKFWTAMKYDTFKDAVKREFHAWLGEAEAARPRAQVGDRITSPGDLRPGDFLYSRYMNWKVVRMTPQGAFLQKVDQFGYPVGDVKRFNAQRLNRDRFSRIAPVKRAPITLDQAKVFVDEKLGYPPREVTSQEKYRQWLEDSFKAHHSSPYRRLHDDEKEHQDSLKEQITKILEERNVGPDWEWKAPPRAQVGHRVMHPLQVQVGDFITYYGHKYKVSEAGDDLITVRPVGALGQPIGSPREFDKDYLDGYPVIRIEAITRPDVSFDKAKRFADEEIGFPPRSITSRAQYQDWLEKQFKETHDQSPYYGLGSDEVEHAHALDKQIKKILEERGITQDWEWIPPPPYDVGDRVEDPTRLRIGDHILAEGRADGYKVIDILANDDVKVIRVTKHGRPLPYQEERLAKYQFRSDYTKFFRIDPPQRKKPTLAEVQSLVDSNYPNPPREVTNYDQYTDWLEAMLMVHDSSPYLLLDSYEELEHYEELGEQIKKILEDRGITQDWKWTPPPPITFSSEAEWEQKQDELRRLAREGRQVGTDERVGRGVNKSIWRRMKIGDKEHTFLVKLASKEQGGLRFGTPKGTLHLREQAAYGLDRLLGEGVIVPPTISDGTGSYQAAIPDAEIWGNGGRRGVNDDDLSRHADVQRMIFLDVLMGHEDRHDGNVMFSWQDPTKDHTIDNLRVHAIDNGYSFADPDAKRGPDDFDIRNPWSGSVMPDVLRKMPESLHERIKQVEVPTLLDTLIKSGIKKPGELTAAAIRLKVLQNNPEVIGKIMQAGHSYATDAQRHFHWMVAQEPEKLLRDYTTLPTSTLAELRQQTQDALDLENL